MSTDPIGPLVLVVDVDASVYVVNMPGREEDQLSWLQHKVGGFLTAIGPGLDEGPNRWVAYLNEDARTLGQLRGRPHDFPDNYVATALAAAAGWRSDDLLLGPVVFAGMAGPETVAVPVELVDLGRATGLLTGLDYITGEPS